MTTTKLKWEQSCHKTGPTYTPGHMLRHTFLKKVTDKHGVHFAQELSGNVSIKEIFRYAKPSQDEMQSTIEELFKG